MKVIIAGSREGFTYPEVEKFILTCPISSSITEVVSGHAYGVDLYGETYANNHNLPIRIFKPDWSIGRSAGYIRNKQMAEYADALIAIWNGKSKGTRSMIKLAKQYGLVTYIYQKGSR